LLPKDRATAKRKLKAFFNFNLGTCIMTGKSKMTPKRAKAKIRDSNQIKLATCHSCALLSLEQKNIYHPKDS